jgi:hypothetical protein
MAVKYREDGKDHYGKDLPEDISAYIPEGTDEIAGYRARWREEDENGIKTRPSKSFSARKLGSLDDALVAACKFLEKAQLAVQVDGVLARPGPDETLTANDLLPKWIENRGPEVSEDYAKNLVKLWSTHIEHRPIARMRLVRISADQGVFARFQDELKKETLRAYKRYEILKTFRTVMRWGRKRHPGVLTVEVNGLIELPKLKRSRLAYAADAIGLERVIEAVLARPARDDHLPLRDAAFVAAMGFTIATRPSEWRLSAAWENLFVPEESGRIGTVELQRAEGGDADVGEGLKTGAHVALMLPNAYERIGAYREALEDRFGPQPSNALIFQVLGPEGPIWTESEDGVRSAPIGWTKSNYNQWTKRVFLPARDIAAQAPDGPAGLERMVFYDCRHSAISIALHSTLVMGPHGMNLHPLAGWAGHDIKTLEGYYRHLIARYMGQDPIDIVEECRDARAKVEAAPFEPEERVGPQREQQQRHRQRRRAAKESRRGQIGSPDRELALA